MLLIAAALLTASMHSLGVVEAPVVPAAQVVTVESAPSALPEGVSVPRPVMTGGQTGTRGAVAVSRAVRRTGAPVAHTVAARASDPLGGATGTATSDQIGRAGVDLVGSPVDRAVVTPTVADVAASRGTAWLTGLAALDRSALMDAGRDARIVATAQDTPPTAAEVQTWWAGLDTGERRTLVTFAPGVVGNLEGVPYAVRDQANRAVLTTGLADPATPPATTAMLGQVRDALVTEPGAPARFLITLDTRGAGRAAVAIGDLGTAADVTVVVPGMFFTVTGQMSDFTDTADDLYSEQATLAGVAAPGSGSGVAVVAWMGYRTPDLSNILSLGLAKTGAERLERAVDGIRQLRDGDQPRMNIVAHSYGSTTAMMALASGRMRADSLTVLGSPGSSVRTASELAVTTGQVFVGDAHSDPVAGSGYFGTDPGGAAFGSTLLDLAGGVDPQDADDVFRRPVGHNDYLKPGTASLHDVALIAVGRGDLVREQVRRGEHGHDGVPQASPDVYLVRPQDLQPRD